MTDKEKAEEYFCEHCENSFEHDNGHCSNCSKWDYFIAGLAEGKPKWHDLKKNPDDLPKESGEYFCKVESSFEKYGVKRFNLKPLWKYDIWEGSGYYVIAWCELPKFEE